MARLRHKPEGMTQDVYEGIVVAQTLRLELGLDDESPVDCILELAERSMAVDVVLAPLHRDVSGFYLPTSPIPIVIVQSTHPVQRQRFTLAHELGHHALGHAAAPRIHGPSTAPEVAVAEASTSDATPTDVEPADAAADSQPAGDSPTKPTLNADHYRPRRNQDPDERAANAFAGELLVPEDGARSVSERWVDQAPLDQAVRLSSHFGISAFAAVVRLETLGRIDKETVRATRQLLAAGDHLPRYRELNLDALDDQLQRHADAGGGSRCSTPARQTLARLRADVDAVV